MTTTRLVVGVMQILLTAGTLAGVGPDAAVGAQGQSAAARAPQPGAWRGLIESFDRASSSLPVLEQAAAYRGAAVTSSPIDPCTVLAEHSDESPNLERLVCEVEAWSRWMTVWGAERALLYGVPSEADIAMARRGARSILWLCDRALALGAAAAGDPNAESAESVYTREDVLPLRAARAMIVMASLSPDAELRTALAREAGAIAERVPGMSAWAQVQRAVIAGQSSLILGETDAALRSFVDAERTLRDSATPGGLVRDAGDEVALASVMAVLRAKGPAAARSLLQTVTEKSPFVDHGTRDPHLALLASMAELRIAQHEAASMTDGAARLATLEDAYQSFALLATRTDCAMSAVDLRRLVYAGLGPVVAREAPLEVLPAVVSVARARHLAELQRTPEALAVLEPLLRRTSDELGAVEPDAMWLAAALMAGSEGPGERRRAADLFMRLAQEFPNDPQSAQAVEAACSAAFRLFNDASPAEPSTRERAREFLIEALQLAHNSRADVPRQQAWRLELCRQLTSDPAERDAQRTLARLEEAAAVMATIEANTLDRATAAYLCAAGWSSALEIAGRRPEAFEAAGMTVAELAEETLLASESARAQIEAALRAQGPSVDEVLRQASRSSVACAGEALLALGRAQEGWSLVSSLSGATPRDEVNPRVARAAVHLLVELGGMSEARAWLERLCDISPDWARWTMAELSDRAWAMVEPAAMGFAADSELESSAESAVPMLRLVDDAAHCRSMEESDTYRRRLAWGLIVSGDGHQAARVFEELIATHGRQVDLLRGLGEARLAYRDDAGAFPVFREIAGALENDGRRDRNYWHSWTRMIQILGRQNGDGSRTATILREARRLLAMESSPNGAMRSVNAEYVRRIATVADGLDE